MITCRRANRGFTLVELLLVIIVLALLAAIGGAVGAQVREKSRRTVCISHLRQIGQALAIYRQDYDDPIDFVPIGGLRSLYPRYVRDKRILRCPTDPTDYGNLPYTPVSYMWQVLRRTDPEDNPENLWPRLYPRRGNDYPVVVDPWHQIIPRVSGYPWIVLRLDGRVQVISHRVRDTLDL